MGDAELLELQESGGLTDTAKELLELEIKNRKIENNNPIYTDAPALGLAGKKELKKGMSKVAIAFFLVPITAFPVLFLIGGALNDNELAITICAVIALCIIALIINKFIKWRATARMKK